jgi:hypothetical protein
MTSFENTFNAPLNNFTLRSSFIAPSSTAKVAGTPVITSNVITSNNTDTLELSPLTAKEALQRARFANFSPEQVQQRVAESLVTFLNSPVSEVLSQDLPVGLKNNPRFALLMSEKAVEYV